MGNHLNQFHAKTWLLVVYAGFFGTLGLVVVLVGTTLLCGVQLAANGRTPEGMGLLMLVVGLVMLAFSALAVFNIIIRRGPVLEINQDGLALNIIGRSSLEKAPQTQSLALVSRQQRLWAPWSSVRAIEIAGHPLGRTLTIQADFFETREAWLEQQPAIAGRVAFGEAELDGSLDEVAETIRGFARPSY